jgi:hypothetical protein
VIITERQGCAAEYTQLQSSARSQGQAAEGHASRVVEADGSAVADLVVAERRTLVQAAESIDKYDHLLATISFRWRQ